MPRPYGLPATLGLAAVVCAAAAPAFALEPAKIDARDGPVAVFRQTCLDLQAPGNEPQDFMKHELGYLVIPLSGPPKIWTWDVPPFKKRMTLAYALEPYRCVVAAPSASTQALLAAADEAFGAVALQVTGGQLRAYRHAHGRIEILPLEGPNPFSPWGPSVGIQLVPERAPSTSQD